MSWTCAACDEMGNDVNSLKAAILALQNEIKELKICNYDKNNSVSNTLFEEVTQEVYERQRRRCNIIIFGAGEQPITMSKDERLTAEKKDVEQILKIISPNFDADQLIPRRLGRFEQERSKPRPIKLTLSSEDQVHHFIKQAKNLKNSPQFKHLSVAFDKTPKQIEFHKQLKSQLEDRRKKGENLTIKFVHGMPKIVNLN